ncbi:hypothetical protein HPP92_017569 [Vanilla planifolia]|uniref:H(+)/Pi cotransporter n=1 Tax=Vanilla planifolia TaxID=51239 RepID=A0A835QEA3_VANPL|nr:hypothetical protein HPP92_017569 [Vanilla planifolia]
MADAAPLLCSHNNGNNRSAHESLQSINRASSNSIDLAIERHLGDAGARHILRSLLAALPWMFDAQQSFISVFTDAPPPWHCTSPSCSPSFSTPCNLPPSSWSYSLPRCVSIVSEWSIHCASPALLGLPASAYFAGCLVGGFLLSTLADSRLGRKATLFLTSFAMSIFAALTAFSSNITVYATLRFACGFARSTVGTTAFVLSTELVSRRWRNTVSIFNFFCFTSGFLSLPAIAYLNRASSWRALYLWTSIPSIFCSILIYFFVHESPRWLLVKGRTEEAIKTLRKVSASKEEVNSAELAEVAATAEAQSKDAFSAARILWGTPWAFRRLAVVMVVCFGIGMVYYGMPLNLGNLDENLYLSVTLNALAELPSSLASFVIVGGMNRRSSTMVLTSSSGICSLVCAAMIGGWPEMAVEVAAFIAACTAFDLILLYGLELFPTCVRNTAISAMRQVVVFGGAVAPLLAAEGRGKGFMTFVVFGLVILFTGLFAYCLPETRSIGLTDTMEEEESRLKVAKEANP